MKVLFLDIDGVLNSVEWSERRKPNPLFGQLQDWQKDAEDSIDPDAMERVNRIVERTGCAVVLSSSRRKEHPLHVLTRILRYRGARFRLLACTPSIYRSDECGSLRASIRGEQIDWWLRQARLGDASCVILDDDSDMGRLCHRLVQTDHRVGITDEDVARVIKAFLPEQNNDL